MSTPVCRGCRATLTPRDRYCPGCGTPNLECTLHPKLPPLIEEREAYIDLTAGPGEVACPRCRRAVDRGDPFCRFCGFALDGGSPWREAAEAIAARGVARPYRPADRAAMWARWLLRIMVVLAAIVAGTSAVLAVTVREVRARPTPSGLDRMDAFDDIHSMSVAALAGLGLLGAVVGVVWLRRVLANGPALGATPARLGLGWVAPGLLVPGLNLVVPPILLDEAWRGSDPEVPRLDGGRWRSAAAPVTLWLGWGMFILFWVVLAMSQGWDPSTDVLANDQFTAMVDSIAYGVLALSLIVLHAALLPLTERQDLRAQRLGVDQVADAADSHDTDPQASPVPVLHEGDTWGRY